MTTEVASSLTPVTVTVCAMSQLDVVKVSGPETVAVATLAETGVTVTVSVGWLSRTTVYSAGSFSATVRAAGSVAGVVASVMPAVSSSVMVPVP